MLDTRFEFAGYIQKRLKDIDDLDERRFAKELLLENLCKVFTWTERKYDALEQRIQNELDAAWKHFNVRMTIVDRKDYDPINGSWFPVCEEDIMENPVRNSIDMNIETIYLSAGEDLCRKFSQGKTVTGIDRETGEKRRFRIEKSKRYQKSIEKLYALFTENHVAWQTLHLGHLERFYDLIPEEGTSEKEKPEKEEGTPEKERGRNENRTFRFGEWDKYMESGKILLWNIEKTSIHSSEFRMPCIDEVFYEHIFYLPQEQAQGDGYLIEAGEEILSIRYEKNKIVLKTEKESLENVFLYRLYQQEAEASIGYHYPVLTNYKKDSMAIRYSQQTGNFIQSPLELYRKIEEMSGSYHINVLGYEITSHADGDLLHGDMNAFTGTKVFGNDKRSILLFKIQEDEEETDYLYEAQIRYILSGLQMEFLEYRCAGVLVKKPLGGNI